MTLAEELAKAKADIANGVEDCPWCLFSGQEFYGYSGACEEAWQASYDSLDKPGAFLEAFDRAIAEAAKS